MGDILEQLSSPHIVKVMKVLEIIRSPYHASFKALMNQLSIRHAEAKDNVKFLDSLRPKFTALLQSDFTEIAMHFKPTMHTLLMIWKHSKFYNTPPALALMVRMLCNDVIEKAHEFLGGTGELFGAEPKESVEKINRVLNVCRALKSDYYMYYALSKTQCEHNPWMADRGNMFKRLDLFITRCEDLLHLCRTAQQFEKLITVVIGGIAGAALTQDSETIAKEFDKALNKMKELTYDVLDVQITKFEEDITRFSVSVKELETRVAKVLGLGFEECDTISKGFKLVDSFGDLLERDFVQADLEAKQLELIRIYAEELKQVQELFTRDRTGSASKAKFFERDGPPLYINMPPVSGALAWVQGLRRRLEEPMRSLMPVLRIMEDTDEVKDVKRMFDSIIKVLREYEDMMFDAWQGGVDTTLGEKLTLPLITRDPKSQEIEVNFDLQLTKLLSECKYFVMQKKKIPDVAQQLFDGAETFRVHTANLTLVKNKYNEMLRIMLDVEKPLLKGSMKAIDKVLDRGLKVLVWKSPNPEKDAFITEALGLVEEAYKMLHEIKKNMNKVNEILAGWVSLPFMTRLSINKTYNPSAYMEEHSRFLETRTKDITEGIKKIHEYVKESNECLKVSKGAPAWRAYVEFMNNILINGVADTVVASLGYLLAQLDPKIIAKLEKAPFFDIKLDLNVVAKGDDAVFFAPPLDGKEPSVTSYVTALIADFYNIVKGLKRLDRTEGDFLKEMEENEMVRFNVHRIVDELEANQTAARELRAPFLKHRALWAKDIAHTLEVFLDEATVAADENNPQIRMPNLAVFEARITELREEEAEIKALQNVINEGWLRIDAKPTKMTLTTLAAKWIDAYTSYLKNHVLSELDGLGQFIGLIKETLTSEALPSEGDRKGLFDAMARVRDVRNREDRTNNLFVPLKDTIQLLKKFGVAMPEGTTDTLEMIPFSWEDTKKITLNARENLGPLQAQEQDRVREETEVFRGEVSAFTKRFHDEAPFEFKVGCDAAYVSINKFAKELMTFEKRAVDIARNQELFELAVTNWRDLKTIRTELTLLKLSWDFVQYVQDIFGSFRATLWTAVDVEAMSDQTKKLQKEVKTLNKAIHKWDVHIGLMALVASMSISLEVVAELRDDAMRERHWKQLMVVCKQTFIMDDKLQLDALLKLELDKFRDPVGEIVERARAEIKIDLQLQKIIKTWSGLFLFYKPYKTSGVQVLEQPGDVFEALDDNEVVLQNMMGNRFVGFFETTVTSWKAKLAATRSTLDVWLEVSRSWMQLESIFLASEDIREQLPEDAKRFDAIDAAFREQMADACQNNNPIEVCMASGREEVFKKNFEMLELCQKSLGDYLEVKKKKFPRFYFISGADLVDILSKGRYAPNVQPHFSKFTDATGFIDWAPDADGKLTGLARGCIAIDGEKFPYPEPKMCEGAVEDWLLELMKHQAAMFRIKVKESLDAYLDNPREKWIDMYGSQHCIQTGQVWWTAEVHAAYDRLEQGNENAMKEYLELCRTGLKNYAAMVLGEMTGELRTKVKTLITIDTHAREIVEKLVIIKSETPTDFTWASQLKFRWPDADGPQDLYINICDAEFASRHEYVGNPGRLVITALTDRCYITLTQALRLMMGGAPQGPAGTGKTETTKDLGRGLSIWVIVSNCSDQMNNKVTGSFFSGLAQTGAWGCFDEFNRITVEVLSVVATQYGSILQGIRANKTRFMFEEEEINLVNSIGAWITMNPGYAGRAELPENLKALFRPCAMVTPNFENIAEINLAGEGFVESKDLANKFVTMYYVCGQLLSKQMHYDWGLRAMSGVLRIAGGMKRADPDKSEKQILMRAMRDTNLPKFVQADFGIFQKVITDLYPGIDCPAIINPALKQAIQDVIKDPETHWWGTLGRPVLQAEENFVIKTINLFEALSVRHCVFVLGTAGAAKSELWKTLAAAQSFMKIGGGNTLYNPLNPKAVTSNELYGYVHPVTKENFDGVIAKIMRDFASVPPDHKNVNVPKWMVLDGDIDAEWIESMNTVMDDNRILTLTTNERIPLTKSMKLILEISHLRNASPATASRAGCVFLNETDVGWRPYVAMWVETMGDAKTQTILEQLFETMVAPTLSMIRKEKWEHVTPVKDLAIVEVICRILEAVLTPETCPAGSEKEVYESFFQFAAVWGIGGAFGSDKGADFRKALDGYWRTEFGKLSMRFPDEGSIFDYFIDPTTKKNEPKRCTHWREIVPGYTHDRAESYSRIFVPTLDTTRLLWFSNNMLKLRKPIMFVGNSGSAKTVVANVLLRQQDEEVWMYNIISFNSFTIAASLQGMLEAPLEKKTGTIFGPPGIKKLIYFIDDFNMPSPDKYGNQSSISLLNQLKDYGGFYDLKGLRMKRVDNTLVVAAMNPFSGTFYVQDRMQRHFCTLSTPFPSQEVLTHIYKNIMGGHFEIFNDGIRDALPMLLNFAVALHNQVADNFVPSAVKFHYQWNLRAMASVFQGLYITSPANYKDPVRMARLLIHEAYRVYSDRMVIESDCEKFQELVTKNVKAHLAALDQEALNEWPIQLFSTFVEEAEGEQKMYLPIEGGYEQLSKLLTKQLAMYNESFAIMNLVLFNQAMEHIARISRIIDNPRGNGLLVGVGGSGKQSLTRLAAFIGGCEIFSIKLTSSYNVVDFKEDLRNIYLKTGVKAIPTVFLFTDQQIFHENALIFLNDILSLGYPPGLFAEEDRDTICNGVRNDAKQAGYMDAKEQLWEFFINRVRALLHICLCMSPVGDKMRNRCRKFPALTSCTTCDWFFNWPQQALISVAERFLSDIPMESPEVKKATGDHMAFVHESVGVAAEEYRASERREVYTTPKSYLELIALYKDELLKNRSTLQVLKDQLAEGLIKLADAEQQVADMQITLKEESAFVAVKSKETDELIIVVGKESIVATEEGAKAAIEEAEVAEIAKGVAEFQVQANKDLAAAEPAIQKAMAALGGLNKAALGELKGLGSPPAAVLDVTAAVSYMLAPKGANLKKLDITWNGAKKMMGDPAAFLVLLQNYDKDGFDLAAKAMVRAYTGTIPDPKGENPMGLTMGHPSGNGDACPTFNFAYMAGKSSAAAGLCDWIVNICIYHDIYLDVAPKRAKLNQAEADLAAANKKLAGVRAHVKALDDRMAFLTNQLETATNEKNALVAKAEATQKRANLANRLVNGLSSEGKRWKEDVGKLDEKMRLLVGDVLMSSSFVAYIAPFSRQFRDSLVDEKWKPDMLARGVPLTAGFDPMNLLTDSSKTASWQAEGLPADPLSTQNASIICKCARFPLIIDPQMQAVAWINGREKPNGLVTTVPGAKGWLNKVAKALEEGLPLLLENLNSVVEAILDNLVARAYVRKGTKVQVYLGDMCVDLCLKKGPDGLALESGEPNIKVYMQSRLPNPHYIPEVQAQTTLVNFTVTEKGLEDQLLSTVVGHERPDLLKEAKELVEMQNGFTIKLKELGDNLLYLLATAEGDILANEALIITLEETKVTVGEINAKQVIAAKKEVEIAKTFELYRPDAARGSLIYFLMNKLNVMGPMYQYSLAAFNFIFYKALDKAQQPEDPNDVSARVGFLLDSVTYTLFKFVSSGLFERHRLTFSTQLAINICRAKGEFRMMELDLMVQAPKDNSKENPVAAWLTDQCWGACCALAQGHEEFSNLPADLEASWKRWKEWSEHPTPELEPLPSDWKRLGGFQQLLLMRAIRPDRICLALRTWVISILGAPYGEAINFNLPVSFEDSGPAVPIFFLLSPGVDATQEVRVLGNAQPIKMNEDAGRLITVSLGQGQEPVAEKALDRMHTEGGWAMLENIELVAGWLPKLEKKLEALETDGDPLFRVFLSAMPQPVVPVPILQKSIKLTNEPPTGLKANLKRAYLNFGESLWEASSKQSEFKAIVFSLCFFHSVACERRKFGPLGWNRAYPFAPGDLKDSIAVANNYLEAGGAIPWADLRYLFGEVFYGGHITDNYDRALCEAYLAVYLRFELLEGIAMFPGFASPPTLTYKGYLEYIDEGLDRETPIAYGLHPNAEINFMTMQANQLFTDISNLSPKGGGGGEGGMTMTEKVKLTLDDILERLPEQFGMLEIMERIEDVTPYTGVFLQELDRMNALTFEVRRALVELDSGLKGDLSITEPMELIMYALADGKVPMKWEKLAWASRDPLAAWLANLIARHLQLLTWTGDLAQPKVTWVPGLFNAQAFENAVKQVTSRKKAAAGEDWPLNKLVTIVEVTKKMSPEEVESQTKDGAYVYGLYMEGARWDSAAGCLEDAFMKDLYPKMPVILMKAILGEKEDRRGVYLCPVYKQTERATPGTATPGTGFVFMMQLKTKQPATKWTMAGVAMLLAID